MSRFYAVVMTTQPNWLLGWTRSVDNNRNRRQKLHIRWSRAHRNLRRVPVDLFWSHQKTLTVCKHPNTSTAWTNWQQSKNHHRECSFQPRYQALAWFENLWISQTRARFIYSKALSPPKNYYLHLRKCISKFINHLHLKAVDALEICWATHSTWTSSQPPLNAYPSVAVKAKGLQS